MDKVEMKISKLALRMLELGKIIGDGTLRVAVIGGEPIPHVDIFLTEDEFIDNANPEFQEFDYTITKELCGALCSFGFIPRAGFLSKNVKLLPHAKTITEAIDERDDSFLKCLIDRKQTIYDAQQEGKLSCKDNLEYVGVRNIAPTSNYDVSQYQGWEPIYLLSQIEELKKVIFRVAGRAIGGANSIN